MNDMASEIAITTPWPLHQQLLLLVLIVGWDWLSLFYVYIIITIYRNIIQALLIGCDVQWDVFLLDKLHGGCGFLPCLSLGAAFHLSKCAMYSCHANLYSSFIFFHCSSHQRVKTAQFVIVLALCQHS